MTILKTPTHKRVVGLLTAILFAIAGLGAYVYVSDPGERPDRRDFTLQDTQGQAVKLDSFKGKWVLMFFGYTSCPDICPNTLLNITNTLAAMGADAQNVQPVFITIDPERDTAAVVRDYLANFDKRFVGLTGTAKQIALAAAHYQTFYNKRKSNDGGYTMDHSTAISLLSPAGVYLRSFRPDDPPEDFAKEILAVMKEIKP